MVSGKVSWKVPKTVVSLEFWLVEKSAVQQGRS